MLPQHEVFARHVGRRVSLYVVVEPKVTKQQLEELTKDLVASSEPDHIDYVDFFELVAAKPSLGAWDQLEGSSFREKDWQRRPTQQDVQLWAERGSISTTDENAAHRLAARHGLDADAVMAGITRVRDWIADADA